MAFFEYFFLYMSLSARRAWIEISMSGLLLRRSIVALRKESVDRNAFGNADALTHRGSLSARRAWIEILKSALLSISSPSLSARRAWIEIK